MENTMEDIERLKFEFQQCKKHFLRWVTKTVNIYYVLCLVAGAAAAV